MSGFSKGVVVGGMRRSELTHPVQTAEKLSCEEVLAGLGEAS